MALKALKNSGRYVSVCERELGIESEGGRDGGMEGGRERERIHAV